MLTYSEVKELSAITGNGHLFVSLYLNVNPVTNPKGDYAIHFKSLLKKIRQKIGKDAKKTVSEDFEKIEAYLADNKRSFNKSIAIFSSSPLGVWKNYNLSLPVKNELIVDNTPYIKPLLGMLDNYQRYAVLLVDKVSARIFVIYLGEIEEYTELFTPDIPGKHKKGGWFSLQQTRFERHIDYHVSLHIKDVIKIFEDFLHKEDIHRIIIGGTEEAVVKIKEMLPRSVSSRIISEFSARMAAGEKEVLDQTLKIIDKYEMKEEKNIVGELMAKAMKNDMAVTGAENVLANLQKGNIMRLVFMKDLKKNGFRCNDCNFLTIQKTNRCPYCKGKFMEIKYMIDFIAQKAVEQGALIKVITESREFEKAGGIGAFLRF